MDLKEMVIGRANWIPLAQYWVQWWTFLSTVMNLWVS
jgi:hypothetical protein